MPDSSRLALIESPDVRPFLPMLYVAWSDGHLAPREIAAVRRHIAEEPWLKPATRMGLEKWLDVDDAPTKAELRHLRAYLAEIAHTLPNEARVSLIALGMALVEDREDDDKVKATLAELESLLDARVESLPLDLRSDESLADLAAHHPSTFDVKNMQRFLDGRYASVRERVRMFLSDPKRRATYGLPKDRHREMVSAWLRDFASVGLGNYAYPNVTTQEKDLGAFLAAFETLAMGDLSLLIKAGVQFGLFGGSLYFLGTEQHHARLDDVASMRLLGCFAMSEVGHGSNVADLETTARYDAGREVFVIHTPRESARKDWVGGAAETARMATVFAQLEVDGEQHGIHAFLVPIRDASGKLLPGVRAGDCGHKMGLNGVDNGRLWFNNVAVGRAALLDRFATVNKEGKYESKFENANRRFFAMLGTLVGGRVSVASGAVTAAKVGLAIAVRYATARRQFGKEDGSDGPRETLLIDYPTHQRRLLPYLASTYALHFAIAALRAEYTSTPLDGDTRKLEGHAAGLKALASRHATDVLQECREACGGQGYLSVNRIADLKSDTDVFTTFEGDNTVLLQLVAKNALGAFNKQLGDGGTIGLIKFIGERVTQSLLEKNVIVTRLVGGEHLRDASVQLGLFSARKDDLIASAARRIKKRIDEGIEPGVAILQVQEHLIALAVAETEHFIFNAFYEAVVRCEDEEIKGWLEKLLCLHALTKLEEHSAWYLENGYFEAPKASAIRKLIPVLFSELKDGARSLVDAFGIPDVCLAAPIAFFDPARRL